VTLTAQLRGASGDAVALDDPVELGVERREDGPPLLTVTPV
jgi:hypothetical protein